MSSTSLRNPSILIISLASSVDRAGEWSGIIGAGSDVTVLNGADRQKIEMALAQRQFNVIHIAGHGAESVIEADDGLLPESELVTLLEQQRHLEFVVLATCEGFETASSLHNILHVPCVAYNAPVSDRAVLEFGRSFYRAWRSQGDVMVAVRRAQESLAILYPNEARKVKLINGDMITPARFSGTIDQITVRLGEIQMTLNEMEQRFERLEAQLARDRVPRGMLILALIILMASLVMQISTPFLNGVLMH